MDVTSSNSESHHHHHHHHHIIDITTRNANVISNSSSSRFSSRNFSSTRRFEGYGHYPPRGSPLNSGIWISVELFVTLSQIIASAIVLTLSRNEEMSQAPLFTWIVGYAFGCVSTLPVLYWRYRNRNHRSTEDYVSQGSSGSNPPPLHTSYTVVSHHVHVSDEENGGHAATESAARNTRINAGDFNSRLDKLVEHFKLFLDCFFAIWFVVGNVWIFGSQSSSSEAPNLYRLCVVFLTFSCIGYAMPFILCGALCCCLPCIVSLLGARPDEFSLPRRATEEPINALPIYRFTVRSENSDDANEDNTTSTAEGGIYAEGTNRERSISGEDAECCICLGEYADNDELRELPCLHFFHVQCVDTWLNIKAICPLCESPVGMPPSAGESTQR